MKFLEKLRKLGKKGKLAVCTAFAAMSTAALSVCASAAETDVSDKLDMATVMQDAGDILINSFNSLIQTMIPIVLGILGGGLVIFGLMALIRLGKKVFTKVTG